MALLVVLAVVVVVVAVVTVLPKRGLLWWPLIVLLPPMGVDGMILCGPTGVVVVVVEFVAIVRGVLRG